MVSLNNLDEQIGALEGDEEEDFEDSVWDNPEVNFHALFLKFSIKNVPRIRKVRRSQEVL